MNCGEPPFANRPYRWFKALLRDIHFWVPATVLLVGLLFLRWVR